MSHTLSPHLLLYCFGLIHLPQLCDAPTLGCDGRVGTHKAHEAQLCPFKRSKPWPKLLRLLSAWSSLTYEDLTPWLPQPQQAAGRWVISPHPCQRVRAEGRTCYPLRGDSPDCNSSGSEGKVGKLHTRKKDLFTALDPQVDSAQRHWARGEQAMYSPRGFYRHLKQSGRPLWRTTSLLLTPLLILQCLLFLMII